jgi:hypothetical protein
MVWEACCSRAEMVTRVEVSSTSAETTWREFMNDPTNWNPHPGSHSLTFDSTPDCIGLGRIIVDGKYYGLPAEAVKMLHEIVMGAMTVLREGKPLTDEASRSPSGGSPEPL